jgi:hypothetical protein
MMIELRQDIAGDFAAGTSSKWLETNGLGGYASHAHDPKAAMKIDEAAGFKTHLMDAVLGQIGEIFDGDPPHKPRGAAAQAWSVAELLRVISDGS